MRDDRAIRIRKVTSDMTTPAQITIRPLRHEDRARWDVLWTAYLAFYETSRPEAHFDLQFSRLLGDDPRDFNGLVAEVEGGVIGLVHYVHHRHGWMAEDTTYLQDLYVDPAVRGTGAGRALIEAVYAAADAAGAPSVYWLTQDFNTTARQLYDRVGVQTPFIKYTRQSR